MGFAASGACYPTRDVALAAWCAHVEPGDNAMSCQSCDATAGTCSITYQPSNPAPPMTSIIPVYTPACDVPTPVDDALAYSGAIVLLWVAIWAAKQVYNLFRVPPSC